MTEQFSPKEKLLYPNGFAYRYKSIEDSNLESFYLKELDRRFDVFMSTKSIKQNQTHAVQYILGGNMSDGIAADGRTLGPRMINGEVIDDSARSKDAQNNMRSFFKSLDVSVANVRILSPQLDYSQPLIAINLDELPIKEVTDKIKRIEVQGDFIYTYNPELVLAATPGDCPLMIVSAETPKGTVYILVHFPWRGAAMDYFGQTSNEFDRLKIDRSTLRIFLSPGAHAESFPYTGYPKDPRIQYPNTDGLFVDVKKRTDGEKTTWSFTIDVPYFVYNQTLGLGVTRDQVFCDTSDTGALDSEFSSHNRSIRLDQDNTRDLVAVKLK